MSENMMPKLTEFMHRYEGIRTRVRPTRFQRQARLTALVEQARQLEKGVGIENWTLRSKLGLDEQ